MDSERNPELWSGAGEPPIRRPAWVEKAVPPLVVAAISMAAVLAALMHPRSEPPSERPGLMGAIADLVRAPRLLAGGAQANGACAECGVVVAVAPAADVPDGGGARYRMRIRMDDGSLRTVEQRGAVAAGSRVLLAGGSVRVLAQRSPRV